MKIGVPKEIKDNERRVGLVTDNVRELTSLGHEVFVETQAGSGIGITDDVFEKAGGKIVSDKKSLYGQADLIVKVKEPLDADMEYLNERHILFSYLHLAAIPETGKALLKKGITGIAYETVQLADRSLPLLLPMSEIAGRMSVFLGVNSSRSDAGGKGLLLSGVPGVAPGRIAILGGGVVGTNAAKVALGLGARVTVLDVNLARLAYLDDIFQGRVTTLMSNQTNLEKILPETDLLIGGVLIVGAAAPKLVKTHQLKLMEKGSVIVDVAVDQGGCIETTRPTSISEPTYVQEGVIHCCITNIPATVARTSTYSLTNATFPYVRHLAQNGLKGAFEKNPALALGLNIYRGSCTHPEVATSLGVKYDRPQI